MTDVEQYLSMYPNLRKWINRCIACGAVGYKKEIPEPIYKHRTYADIFLRGKLRPLELDEGNLCPTCQKLLNKG